jgi:hypothetical protein
MEAADTESVCPSIGDSVRKWLWTALDEAITPSGVWAVSVITADGEVKAVQETSSSEPLDIAITRWLWTALDDAIPPARTWADSGEIACDAVTDGTFLVETELLEDQAVDDEFGHLANALSECPVDTELPLGQAPVGEFGDPSSMLPKIPEVNVSPSLASPGEFATIESAAMPAASIAAEEAVLGVASASPKHFDLTADEAAMGSKFVEQYDLTASDNVLAHANDEA